MSEEQKQQNEINGIARRCIEVCEEKKAADIVLFDVQEASELADYYLICCGTSLPHIRAIADALRRQLIDAGYRPKGQDGAVSSQWIVMDYGSILIHIMSPEMRRYYALEDLWDKRLVVFEGGEALPPVVPGAPKVEKAVGEGWEEDEEEAPLGDELDDEDFDDEDFEEDGTEDCDMEGVEFVDDEQLDEAGGNDDEFLEEDDYEDDEEEFDEDDYEEVEDEEEDKPKGERRGEPQKGYTLEELLGEKKNDKKEE